MLKFHAVAYSDVAPNRRFTVRAATGDQAIVTAKSEARTLGFAHVMIEDVAGSRLFDGASTDCDVFFSDCDPDDEPGRSPDGGWYFREPGASGSSGPYSSQSEAIREAARA